MKKDIEIPVDENVFVAAVKESNGELLAENWYVYVINARHTYIETVIVVSKGYGDAAKTSTIRRSIEIMPARSFQKIELLPENLLALENEFFITFFADGKLYERKCVFKANSISDARSVNIPVLEQDGVWAY
ncbi:hypothetical protein ACEZ3G_07055 [Maribacter algicola]|uniref:Uncharacterized protein n=1 Tax=Meishania litoralis TaxID=3434685 RepID=A0ACC7LJ18_9FLAO